MSFRSSTVLLFIALAMAGGWLLLRQRTPPVLAPYDFGANAPAPEVTHAARAETVGASGPVLAEASNPRTPTPDKRPPSIRVLNRQGHPLSGAEFRPWCDDRMKPRSPALAITDEEGYAEFQTNPRDDHQVLAVQLSGHRTKRFSREESDGDIVMDAGVDAFVQCVDERERPLSGVTVFLSATPITWADIKKWDRDRDLVAGHQDVNAIYHTESQFDGRASFRGLACQEHHVVAMHDSYGLAFFPNRAAVMRLTAPGSLRLVFQPFFAAVVELRGEKVITDEWHRPGSGFWAGGLSGLVDQYIQENLRRRFPGALVDVTLPLEEAVKVSDRRSVVAGKLRVLGTRSQWTDVDLEYVPVGEVTRRVVDLIPREEPTCGVVRFSTNLAPRLLQTLLVRKTDAEANRPIVRAVTFGEDVDLPAGHYDFFSPIGNLTRAVTPSDFHVRAGERTAVALTITDTAVPYRFVSSGDGPLTSLLNLEFRDSMRVRPTRQLVGCNGNEGIFWALTSDKEVVCVSGPGVQTETIELTRERLTSRDADGIACLPVATSQMLRK